MQCFCICFWGIFFAFFCDSVFERGAMEGHEGHSSMSRSVPLGRLLRENGDPGQRTDAKGKDQNGLARFTNLFFAGGDNGRGGLPC